MTILSDKAKYIAYILTATMLIINISCNQKLEDPQSDLTPTDIVNYKDISKELNELGKLSSTFNGGKYKSFNTDLLEKHDLSKNNNYIENYTDLLATNESYKNKHKEFEKAVKDLKKIIESDAEIRQSDYDKAISLIEYYNQIKSQLEANNSILKSIIEENYKIDKMRAKIDDLLGASILLKTKSSLLNEETETKLEQAKLYNIINNINELQKEWNLNSLELDSLKNEFVPYQGVDNEKAKELVENFELINKLKETTNENILNILEYNKVSKVIGQLNKVEVELDNIKKEMTEKTTPLVSDIDDEKRIEDKETKVAEIENLILDYNNKVEVLIILLNDYKKLNNLESYSSNEEEKANRYTEKTNEIYTLIKDLSDDLDKIKDYINPKIPLSIRDLRLKKYTSEDVEDYLVWIAPGMSLEVKPKEIEILLDNLEIFSENIHRKFNNKYFPEFDSLRIYGKMDVPEGEYALWSDLKRLNEELKQYKLNFVASASSNWMDKDNNKKIKIDGNIVKAVDLRNYFKHLDAVFERNTLNPKNIEWQNSTGGSDITVDMDGLEAERSKELSFVLKKLADIGLINNVTILNANIDIGVVFAPGIYDIETAKKGAFIALPLNFYKWENPKFNEDLFFGTDGAEGMFSAKDLTLPAIYRTLQDANLLDLFKTGIANGKINLNITLANNILGEIWAAYGDKNGKLDPDFKAFVKFLHDNNVDFGLKSHNMYGSYSDKLIVVDSEDLKDVATYLDSRLSLRNVVVLGDLDNISKIGAFQKVVVFNNSFRLFGFASNSRVDHIYFLGENNDGGMELSTSNAYVYDAAEIKEGASVFGKIAGGMSFEVDFGGKIEIGEGIFKTNTAGKKVLNLEGSDIELPLTEENKVDTSELDKNENFEIGKALKTGGITFTNLKPKDLIENRKGYFDSRNLKKMLNNNKMKVA